MSIRWQDYTERVRIGHGKKAHLASKKMGQTACDDWCYPMIEAPEDWPLCKACRRAIEAAKRRAP